MPKVNFSRAQKRGIKPISQLKLPPNIKPSDVSNMGRKIEGILANNHPFNHGEENITLLKQVYFLSQRRQAIKEGKLKEADSFLRQLNHNEENLHRLGFYEDEHIVPLNCWVLDMENRNQLEKLLRRLENKYHE